MPARYLTFIAFFTAIATAAAQVPLPESALEVYSRPAIVPLEFKASGGECGAIVVWTQSRKP